MFVKKTSLSVFGEKIIHSNAIGDVLLEREFNYVYDIYKYK